MLGAATGQVVAAPSVPLRKSATAHLALGGHNRREVLPIGKHQLATGCLVWLHCLQLRLAQCSPFSSQLPALCVHTNPAAHSLGQECDAQWLWPTARAAGGTPSLGQPQAWAPGRGLSTEPWVWDCCLPGAAYILKPAREVAERWRQATVLIGSPGLSIYTLGQLSGRRWNCSSLPTPLLRSVNSLCSPIVGLFLAWPSRRLLLTPMAPAAQPTVRWSCVSCTAAHSHHHASVAAQFHVAALNTQPAWADGYQRIIEW